MSKTGASQIELRRRAARSEGGREYSARLAAIVQTGAEVFREKGYTAATLNDVAERLGTDRASLYYYVGSKEELFQACIEGVLDDNLAQGRQIIKQDISPREKLERLVRVVLASYEASYPHMYVYIQEDMSRLASAEAPWAKRMAQQTRRFEKLFLDLLDEGVADASFRDDVPTVLMANGLFGMLTWTHRWYAPGRKHSIDEIADSFIAVFFDGISRSAS